MVFIYGHQLGVEPWTHHHTTFLAVITLLIALLPCGHSFSLDRWLAIHKANINGQDWPEEVGNVWALRLVALQLSAVYFWGAVNKTRIAFLGGDRIEQPLLYLYFGSDYLENGFIGWPFARRCPLSLWSMCLSLGCGCAEFKVQ